MLGLGKKKPEIDASSVPKPPVDEPAPVDEGVIETPLEGKSESETLAAAKVKSALESYGSEYAGMFTAQDLVNMTDAEVKAEFLCLQFAIYSELKALNETIKAM